MRGTTTFPKEIQPHQSMWNGNHHIAHVVGSFGLSLDVDIRTTTDRMKSSSHNVDPGKSIYQALCSHWIFLFSSAIDPLPPSILYFLLLLTNSILSLHTLCSSASLCLSFCALSRLQPSLPSRHLLVIQSPFALMIMALKFHVRI